MLLLEAMDKSGSEVLVVIADVGETRLGTSSRIFSAVHALFLARLCRLPSASDRYGKGLKEKLKIN